VKTLQGEDMTLTKESGGDRYVTTAQETYRDHRQTQTPRQPLQMHQLGYGHTPTQQQQIQTVTRPDG
jgi:hypothetical protein